MLFGGVVHSLNKDGSGQINVNDEGVSFRIEDCRFVDVVEGKPKMRQKWYVGGKVQTPCRTKVGDRVVMEISDNEPAMTYMWTLRDIWIHAENQARRERANIKDEAVSPSVQVEDQDIDPDPDPDLEKAVENIVLALSSTSTVAVAPEPTEVDDIVAWVSGYLRPRTEVAANTDELEALAAEYIAG